MGGATDSRGRELFHLIDGALVEGTRRVERFNPSDTRELVATVPTDDGTCISAAVEAAEASARAGHGGY